MTPRSLFLIATVALAGCGGGSAPLPSDESSRQALRAALDAWKAGRPASSLLGGKPGVEVADFEWKAGKSLTDYRIGPTDPGQGVRSIAATITLRGEPAPKDVRYLVLGLDPVRLFRDEDYRRAMNMDDATPPARKPRR